MWEIRDDAALTVSERVYKSLWKKNRDADSTRAARGLHAAVGKFRHDNRGARPETWVPFVHYGV